jgi:PAS domain S-box-containing protein
MKEIWPDNIRNEALNHIKQNIQKDNINIFEFSTDKNGRTTYFESRIIKTTENNLIVMTRDISSKKTEELQISRQVNELEDAIKERTGELQKINRTLIDEIDKRNLAEEEIKLFLDVVEQSTNAIIIIDKNGRVKYINNAFSEISGYSKDELIDLDTNSVPNPVMPEDINQNQIKDIDFWKGEMYNAKKSGEIYYLRASISRIKNSEGRVKYIVISGEDITQSKKDAMTLDKMKTSLKNSSSDSIDKDMAWQAWKEKMLSRNISRTDRSIFSNINNSFTQGAGFGTLITFMEMMSKSAVQKDGKFLVDESLFNEAMKNVKIAQDAFKIFAGIDWIISNKIELEKKNVRDIYTIIKGIINKSQKFADYNKHRIVINELPSGLKNENININVKYFTEAFSEIIINALKFSRTGTTIIVMLYSQTNSLRISVINDPQKTGDGIVGIPDEYQKVVFEPFYRLSKLVYEKYNTLDFGIGLTFAEKIITRHGGEIFAENILDYSDIDKDPQTKVNLMISLPFSRD